MCFAPQQRALFRHRNFKKWSEPGVLCTCWLGNVLRATTACAFSASQLPKVVWTWSVFSLFTCKCASRHNGVHFFDISTPKNAPVLKCFVHFDLERCFAPQRRALFPPLDFQKWSEREVLLAFSLANVLRATTACTFSTSQLPKVLLLYILTWKCASRHNGVHFFIPHGATTHWKTAMFRDFPTFSHTCILFFLTLCLLWSSLSSALLFSILLLHLCFSSVHIVGSLISKLPSISLG